MKKIFLEILVAVFTIGLATAQQPDSDIYELTGSVTFESSNPYGFISNAALFIGDGGTGDYKAAMIADSSLTTHTLYMPYDLTPFYSENKLPVVVYGNGACRNGSVEIRNFLSEIASHGYLVIAVGPFKNALFDTCEADGRMSDPQSLIDGIDWAIEQNNLQESRFYGRIDTENIAVMGQSCGGAMAMASSKDPRVTTVVMLNSGLFPESPETENAPQGANPVPANGAMPVTRKSYLETMKPSIVYLVGGETDMATPNAMDDFKYINSVPVLVASYDFSDKNKENQWGYGHYPATYREDNGGDFAIAATAWLDWQLKGKSNAANLFNGTPTKLEENSKWHTVVKKNID